jgi:hypothetical protein
MISLNDVHSINHAVTIFNVDISLQMFIVNPEQPADNILSCQNIFLGTICCRIRDRFQYFKMVTTINIHTGTSIYFRTLNIKYDFLLSLMFYQLFFHI